MKDLRPRHTQLKSQVSAFNAETLDPELYAKSGKTLSHFENLNVELNVTYSCYLIIASSAFVTLLHLRVSATRAVVETSVAREQCSQRQDRCCRSTPNGYLHENDGIDLSQSGRTKSYPLSATEPGFIGERNQRAATRE